MNIQKFQSPSGPIQKKINVSGWTSTPLNLTENQPVRQFIQTGLDRIKNADKRVARIIQADKRANRNNRAAHNMTAHLQDALYNIGAYNDIRNRRGTSLSYDQAVDGMHGKMTDAAIAKAREMGYDVDVNSGTVTKRQQNKPSRQKPSNNSRQRSTMPTFTTSTGMVYDPVPLTKIMKSISVAHDQDPQLGHSIYLHYPNFVGRSSNAIKVGDTDLGKLIGDPDVPVGHAATIMVSPDGNATYYEYGRYANQGFGHVRPTTKGGNWKRIRLPKQKQEENDSVYMARIQHLLPDTHTGAYQAMTIPNVDTEKATSWINEQANNVNRKEYGITNTCADGACDATLPFQIKEEFHPENIINSEGYSNGAKWWSNIPFLSTGAHARSARAQANKVYTMNK